MSERKFPWKEVYNGVVTAVLVGALTWAWNLQGRITRLESQQNIVQRVENLENLLVPIIVDYEVKKELKRREQEAAWGVPAFDTWVEEYMLMEEPASMHDGAFEDDHDPSNLYEDLEFMVPPVLEQTPAAPNIGYIEEQVRQEVFRYRTSEEK